MRFWIKIFFGMALSAGMAGLLSSKAAPAPATARQPSGYRALEGPYITVTYESGVKVRSGPNTAYYPVIGHLDYGQTAPALGRTPGSEWIEISFSGVPGDVGWVYAFYVELSGGIPPIVPTPPPPPLPVTSTVDPALLTALAPMPTNTRLPTFTPPPLLVIPTYAQETTGVSGTPLGPIVIALAIIGILIALASFLHRE